MTVVEVVVGPGAGGMVIGGELGAATCCGATLIAWQFEEYPELATHF